MCSPSVTAFCRCLSENHGVRHKILCRLENWIISDTSIPYFQQQSCKTSSRQDLFPHQQCCGAGEASSGDYHQAENLPTCRDKKVNKLPMNIHADCEAEHMQRCFMSMPQLPQSSPFGTSLLRGLQHLWPPQIEKVICIRVEFQSILAVLPEKRFWRQERLPRHYWRIYSWERNAHL